MTVFADSSAVVKLYADEADQDVVRAVDNLVVSVLARVEVPAAFWTKSRTGELSAAAARLLTVAFEDDFYGDGRHRPRYAVVGLSDALLSDAASLCATRGLRGYDSMQLAAARAARAADSGCRTFIGFDRRLQEAASAEGFDILG